MRSRAAKTAAAVAPASALAQEAPAKRKVGAAQFFREVRAEARKITWTTRRETWITSVMVGIMVVLAAAFFFLVDSALGFSVQMLLNLANGG